MPRFRAGCAAIRDCRRYETVLERPLSCKISEAAISACPSLLSTVGQLEVNNFAGNIRCKTEEQNLRNGEFRSKALLIDFLGQAVANLPVHLRTQRP